MADEFRTTIDLSLAQAKAEKIVECIKDWRERHDLGRFEYTRHLRVAPYEIPHSHPVLTLNARLYNPEEILCEYLRRLAADRRTEAALSERAGRIPRRRQR